eukprot:3027923-Pyramimonas_sp.AAC.1
MGDADFCAEHAEQRVAAAAALLEAVGELENAQAALYLKCQRASFCKLGYSACVVPPTAHAASPQAKGDA